MLNYFRNVAISDELLWVWTSTRRLRVGSVSWNIITEQTPKIVLGMFLIGKSFNKHHVFNFRYINGTRLDDRIVRTDWDAGFIEGRQYGRGKTGGQVRDEYRTDHDSGRGGYGKIIQQNMGVNDGGFSR